MKLSEYHVILASGSPRRIQMLQEQGVCAEVVRPMCSEELSMRLPVHQMVMAIAMKKGRSVLDSQNTADDPACNGASVCNVDGSPGVAAAPRLLIASDTVVYCDEVMGKPDDEADAFRMLRCLSGRAHSVVSGAYLNFIDEGKQYLLYDETRVYVKDVPDRWILDYIATGDPMDKAGAYAIQGKFGEMIDHIEGNYDNVVGFPLRKMASLFPRLDIK